MAAIPVCANTEMIRILKNSDTANFDGFFRMVVFPMFYKCVYCQIGHRNGWIGYKLHLDCADGDIPISRENSLKDI